MNPIELLQSLLSRGGQGYAPGAPPPPEAVMPAGTEQAAAALTGQPLTDAPKVLARLTPRAGEGGREPNMLEAFTSSKLPAKVSGSKIGALAQGFDAGLSGFSNARSKASAEKMEKLKFLLNLDRQLAGDRLQREQFDWRKGEAQADNSFKREQFDYKRGQDEQEGQRNDRRLDIYGRQIDGYGRGNQMKSDPLVTETRIQGLLKNHPARKALDLDAEESIPSKKLPPEKRAALEKAIADTEARYRTMTPGGAPPPAPQPPPAAPAQPQSRTPSMLGAPPLDMPPQPEAAAPRAPQAAPKGQGLPSLIGEAQAAISRGAPAEKIIERMKGMGFDVTPEMLGIQPQMPAPGIPM